MNNCRIFDYLNANSNNEIHNLSKNTILELIYYINQYYLELRDNIIIRDRDTFGFEFEAERFRNDKVYNLMVKSGFNLDNWKIKPDNSIYQGYEVVTPILNNLNIDWNKISEICDIIKNNSSVGIHAASHIHIGAQVIDNNKDSVIKLALLWSAYENILYRFAYGEFLNNRNYILLYAKPVASYFHKMVNVFKNYQDLDPVIMLKWLSRNDKNVAINLSNINSLDKILDKNTMEYRLFNFTLNPIIWQNNYNLVKCLIEYCNSNSFDYDTVKNRIEVNKNNFDNLNYYRKLDIEGAIEFCDLVFNNNLDKIYFLRQYLKNMEETDSKYLTRAKQFTKIPFNS